MRYPLIARLLSFLVLLVLVVGTQSAMGPAIGHADEVPSVEAMLQQAETGDALPQESDALPEASQAQTNIRLQWRIWLQSLTDGDPALDELFLLRQSAQSGGIPALPHHQMALIAHLKSPEAQQAFSPQDIDDLLRRSQQLSPHLPYGSLERSRWLFEHDPTSIYQAFPAYISGLISGFEWLDTRLAWLLRLALIALIAVSATLTGFLLAQLLRYFGVTAYDGTRLLPRGFSSTQTVILLIALVLVPGLLLQSPLLSLLVLALMVMPFQQLNERFVALIFFALLAALPWIDGQVGQMASYPGSDAQHLLHASYHGCGDDPQCRQRLETSSEGGDELALLVERTEEFRQASTDDLRKLLSWLEGHSLAADPSLEAHWLNLKGATAIAIGQSEDALTSLELATQRNDQLVAPWFNKARAHQILGDDGANQRSLEQAFYRDLRRTSAHLDFDRRDPHSFLMLSHIDSNHFWAYHRRQADASPTLIRPFWEILAGPRMPFEWSTPMGLIAILLLFLTAPLYLRRKVSTPCPKCGLARDPTDSEDTGHHHYCRPCYQTFVSGASLDYHARVHTEVTLGRRDRLQRWMRRFFSLVTPGLGHVLGGHALRGTLTFFLVLFGLFLLLFPQGPLGAWLAPLELISADWIGQRLTAYVLMAIALFVGVIGALRGIEATRLATRPNKESSP